MSSLQTTRHLQQAWRHKTSKGEELSKGLSLLPHCLPLPVRQEEIKAAMERGSDHKNACPRYRGFPLDRCNKTEMQANSLRWPSSPPIQQAAILLAVI